MFQDIIFYRFRYYHFLPALKLCKYDKFAYTTCVYTEVCICKGKVYIYKYVFTYLYLHLCIDMTDTEMMTLLGRIDCNLKDGRGTYRFSIALQSAMSSQ